MNHFFQFKSAARLGKGSTLLFNALFVACATQAAPETPPPTEAAAETKSAPTATAVEPISAPEQEATENDFATSKNESAAAKPIQKTLPESFDCSGLTCYRFAETRDAVVPIVLHHKAVLVAFGERHAPADYKGDTTVRRFSEQILPTIGGGATHLLVELMMPPKEGCQEEKRAANEEARQVTSGQSQNNQSEYLALGKNARSLGMAADILYPTCDDLKKIAAPDGGVLAMMETISRLSVTSLKEQLATRKKGRPLVIAYNGALHNDAVARPGREAWTFGPTMMAHTEGHYLEIDLFVPELIGNSETWTSLPWYAAYKALDHKEGAILMRWSDNSYALFFPPSGSADSAPAPH